MRIKGIREEMLFLVSMRIGLSTGFDKRLRHDTMFHGETVFARTGPFSSHSTERTFSTRQDFS